MRAADGKISNETGAKLSDTWVENAEFIGSEYYSPYFKEDGITKTHDFDGEWWLTFTPTRKSYVRLIKDDSYGIGKYINTPVKVEVEALKDSVRTSTSLGETLFYILGIDILKSMGNLHNLYFTELHTIDAKNLTDLILGWDGKSTTDPDRPYKNHGTNDYTFSSMPLVKEINLSNIQYKPGVSTVLDFTNSEKLENFRATGSNFTQIKFAPGVALNTLYLPTTITELKLTEARQLKNVITEYEQPEYIAASDSLKAKPGLYIEHFTDYLDDPTNTECICNIDNLSIINAENMGYDSYKLLNGFYQNRKANNASVAKVAMTDVLWSPYKKVDTGTIHNTQKSYFIDNFHFGLDEYTFTTQEQWETDIKNGVLYVFDDTYNTNEKQVKITDIQMLEDFVKNNMFVSTADGVTIPNITGTIYIDNNVVLGTSTAGSYTNETMGKTYSWTVGSPVDEDYVRNVLCGQYPGITFFFKNITKNNTARFILFEESKYEEVTTTLTQDNLNTGYYFLKKSDTEYLLATTYDSMKTYFKDVNKGVYQTVGIQTIKSGWFKNPIDTYGDISESKANYDFNGWSSDVNGENILVNVDGIDTWATNDFCKLVDGKDTYNIYAVFTIHRQTVIFCDDIAGNDPEKGHKTLQTYNEFDHVKAPAAKDFIPFKSDAGLAYDKTYAFVGWSNTPERTKIIQLSDYPITKDYVFYAVFEEKDVHKVVNYDLFNFEPYNYYEMTNFGGNSSYNIEGYKVSPKGNIVGKVTIPAKYNNIPVVAISGFENQNDLTHVFFAEGSELREVCDYCFCQNNGNSAPTKWASKLKYFEFIKSIRSIGAAAFRTVPLEVYTMPEELYYIGTRAFLDAFVSTAPITMVLGNQITCMSYYAFSNMKIANGSTLLIGGPASQSAMLDLSFNTETANRNRYIRINASCFTSCEFYSANYTSGSDICYEDRTINECLNVGCAINFI